MADYKELLRRAVQALPENNGAARRGVYEKARAALVGQLRAISPPLPAKDITQHRLNLEDCIRQVEQEATDQLLHGLKQVEERQTPKVVAKAAVAKAPPPRAAPVVVAPPPPPAEPERIEPQVRTTRKPAKRPAPGSIEEIIAAAQAIQAGEDEDELTPQTDERDDKLKADPKPPTKPVTPFVVSRKDQPKAVPPMSSGKREAVVKAADPFRPKPAAEPKRAAASAGQAATVAAAPALPPPPSEPVRVQAQEPVRGQVQPQRAEVMTRPMFTPRRQGSEQPSFAEDFEDEQPAMSAVREVEVEPETNDDAQSAIDRAIATLDREARGEEATPSAEVIPLPVQTVSAKPKLVADSRFEEPEAAKPKRSAFDAAELKKRAFAAVSSGRDKAGAARRALSTESLHRPAEDETTIPAAKEERGLFSRKPKLDDGAFKRDVRFRDERETGLAKPPKPAKAPKPVKVKAPKPAKGRDGLLSRKSEPSFARPAALEPAFIRPGAERERGGSALTIFLVVFLLLLVGAGGAGYWAWQEGYIDPEVMFGGGDAPATQVAAISPSPTQTATPQSMFGNTTGAPDAALSAEQAAIAANLDRLPGATETPALSVLPAIPATPAVTAVNGVAAASPAPAAQDRLPFAAAEQVAAATPAAATPVVAVAPDSSAIAGSQSLLLEAADDGRTGAVPFSGTIEWSKGTDELGQPTLIGKANIPARNFGVEVLIRKNSDPSLPASHLMEINFNVNDGFVGGAVAGLPGVLLKNEELVQGTPLAGASARIVGNSFLFALSAAPSDLAANAQLLTSRKWIDLAMIYATGKRAIITLEKDDQADTMFRDVFAAWGQTASAP